MLQCCDLPSQWPCGVCWPGRSWWRGQTALWPAQIGPPPQPPPASTPLTGAHHAQMREQQTLLLSFVLHVTLSARPVSLGEREVWEEEGEDSIKPFIFILQSHLLSPLKKLPTSTCPSNSCTLSAPPSIALHNTTGTGPSCDSHR